MDKKVEELVEWVAKLCCECHYRFEATLVCWEDQTSGEKEWWLDYAEQILSHPDLALIDRETKCMLRDSAHPNRCIFLSGCNCKSEDSCPIYKEFEEKGWRVVISLAEALKEDKWTILMQK